MRRFLVDFGLGLGVREMDALVWVPRDHGFGGHVGVSRTVQLQARARDGAPSAPHR